MPHRQSSFMRSLEEREATLAERQRLEIARAWRLGFRPHPTRPNEWVPPKGQGWVRRGDVWVLPKGKRPRPNRIEETT
jgi:hypothetical protein